MHDPCAGRARRGTREREGQGGQAALSHGDTLARAARDACNEHKRRVSPRLPPLPLPLPAPLQRRRRCCVCGRRCGVHASRIGPVQRLACRLARCLVSAGTMRCPSCVVPDIGMQGTSRPGALAAELRRTCATPVPRLCHGCATVVQRLCHGCATDVACRPGWDATANARSRAPWP